MRLMPTVQDAADRLGVDPSTPGLSAILTAALDVQAQVCTVDPYTDALHEAALRRVSFLWSSRAHHLGTVDNGYGVTQYLPMFHPDWDMLETGARHIPVA